MCNEVINRTDSIFLKGILNKGIPHNIQKIFNKEINYSIGKPNSSLYSIKNKTMYEYDNAGTISHIHTPTEDCSIGYSTNTICVNDNINNRKYTFNLV